MIVDNTYYLYIEQYWSGIIKSLILFGQGGCQVARSFTRLIALNIM